MRNNIIAGAVLAVGAALVVALGHWLGLDLDHVALVGAALGAVIGLVPDRSHPARIGGFLVGFALAWVGFALRAAVLPDSGSGRAVAAFLVVVACLAVSAASMSRIPLWSTLVGVAAIVAAYEETYTNAPSQFLHESPTAATQVLLAAAVGYIATSFLGPQISVSRAQQTQATQATQAPQHRTDHDDDLIPEPAQ